MGLVSHEARPRPGLRNHGLLQRHGFENKGKVADRFSGAYACTRTRFLNTGGAGMGPVLKGV